jgi:hypothetical protein
LLEEHRRAAIAPLRHMMREAGNDQAGKARHSAWSGSRSTWPTYSVMPGHRPSKTGVNALMAGHPRLCVARKTWMAGTSPAMTEIQCERAPHWNNFGGQCRQ